MKKAPKKTLEQPGKKPPELSARQQRFVEEYLIDQNATAAYKRAGYKDTRAASHNVARMMANDGIQAKIRAAIDLRSQANGLTVDRIWEEWRRIALSDMGDIVDFSGTDPKLRPCNEISENARRAISSVEVKRYVEGSGDDARTVEVLKFKLWDKPGVLRDAAKANELFKERIDISSQIDIVGITVISQPRRPAALPPGDQQ